MEKQYLIGGRKRMLKWGNSTIGRYKIIETQKGKFIVDTFCSKPRILLLATSPNTVEFKIYQISSNNYVLGKNKVRTSVGKTSIILTTQPFVTFVYLSGRHLFVNYSVNDYAIFKVALFILSILLSIGIYILVSKIDEYKFKKISGVKKVKCTHDLIIKTKGKKIIQ